MSLSSRCILTQEKVVTCCVALVAQHGATRSPQQARLARHVFRGVVTAWTGVEMSTSLFPEVVPETDANPDHRRLYLYTRALLLLRRPPCCNKHDKRDMSCESCHDVTYTSGICTIADSYNHSAPVLRGHPSGHC